MITGTRIPQRMLVLGAGSALAKATVEALAGRGLQLVVFATRQPDVLRPWIDQLQARHPHLGCATSVFDAADVDSHPAFIEAMWRDHLRLDAVLIAFGVLGPVGDQPSGPASVATLQVDLVGAGSLLLLARDRLVTQGQGQLIVLSSVAAGRPRADNAVYAAAKAGLDALARGISDGLPDDAVTVTVVRPGFVATPMTAELPTAPFATTPQRVAADIVRGIRRGAPVVWSPPILRPVMTTLNHLPAPWYRRITRRR